MKKKTKKKTKSTSLGKKIRASVSKAYRQKLRALEKARKAQRKQFNEMRKRMEKLRKIKRNEPQVRRIQQIQQRPQQIQQQPQQLGKPIYRYMPRYFWEKDIMTGKWVIKERPRPEAWIQD